MAQTDSHIPSSTPTYSVHLKQRTKRRNIHCENLLKNIFKIKFEISNQYPASKQKSSIEIFGNENYLDEAQSIKF